MRASLRSLGLLGVVLSLACDFDYGAGDAVRFEFETDVPIVLRLPTDDLPPAPMAVSLPITARVQMDLVETLRDEGRDEDADALEEGGERIESVQLLRVEYEVDEPNGLDGSVGLLVVSFLPFEVDEPGPTAALGTTVPIPARRGIATREITYAPGGRDAAGALVERLRFALAASGELSVRAGVALRAESLTMRVRLRVRVRMRLIK